MGTNTENNGQSGTKNDEDTDFSAISQALSGGDFESLDRLMAVENDENTSDKGAGEDTDSQSGGITTDPGNDGSNTDDSSQNTGAAPNAAPPEQNKQGQTTDSAEELAALKAELHRLRSDAGRVAHLQRTVQELQRQVRAPEARTPTKPDNTPPKTKEVPEELRKRIESLKEIDPDLADTFDAFAKVMVNTASEEAGQVKQSLAEYQQHQEDLQFYNEQKSALYKMVPRCDEIFGMPEWHEWKQSLTPGQRALTESGYANDMAHAIYVFANHMNARQQAMGSTQRPASSEGGDPSNTNAATQTANQTAEARARKVGAAADVKSSAAKKDTELDGDALFSEYYNKLAKENHIK